VQQVLGMIERKDYKSAHALCIHMIERNVYDPRPYCGLAQIAWDHNNLDKAFELFETARKHAPEDPFYGVQQAKALSP